MTTRLTFADAALLSLPPLLWAGNAVTGRLVIDLVPPMTLNLLRWLLAGLILLPLAGWILRRGSGFWQHLGRFSLLGLLGVGCYNALQYLALHTSTPLNVTLVGAGTPMFTLAVGALCFGAGVSRRQVGGALLSLTGVLLVLTRGDLAALAQVRFVPGDLYMLLANLGWAFYTWLLARTTEPAAIRNDWAAFLLAQIVPGLVWSSLLTAGEWSVAPQSITWGWPLSRSGRRCWLTGAGGWACSGPGRTWPACSSTCRPCSPRPCQPPCSGNCRMATMPRPSCWSPRASWCRRGAADVADLLVPCARA